MVAIFKKNSIHHLVLLQGVVLAKQHPQRSLSEAKRIPSTVPAPLTPSEDFLIAIS
jgi:hypothetical protein